jgi:GntR family transcriptional regulator/MocR family aminotransferase
VRRWELTVTLDAGSELPLFLQLSSAIADDIRRGRLRAGDALPGSRALADRLGVHRNTVIASYGELVAEGLVITRKGGGTFVATPPPLPDSSTGAPPLGVPDYALAAPLPFLPPPRHAPGTLVLAKGAPDVRLLPAEALARAYRRALGRHGRALLTYGDPRGHVRLREELATMLSRTRGVAAARDTVMVTRGSQMALDLVARALLTPGDVVAVEALGHRPAWTALRLSGAQLRPIPVDDDGLDVAELAELARREPLRAVYLTPHHQFPTTTVMTPARRAALAELAAHHRFALVEDDYDHEFHYEGRPVLPIAAGAGRANVIYVGTLSKVLAPGLRAGFIVAPPTVIERLASLRVATDLQGDLAMECAIAELFEDGELLRHVRRMRRLYGARRDALAAALRRHLGGAVDFRLPDGGMALWARIDPAIDIERWAVAGEREGVSFRGARMYDFDERYQPFARLGFSFHDEAELQEAARRMARALKKISGGRAAATAPSRS